VVEQLDRPNLDDAMAAQRVKPGRLRINDDLAHLDHDANDVARQTKLPMIKTKLRHKRD